jgi:glycosyltransferase involved in cell wall biosynthesis
LLAIVAAGGVPVAWNIRLSSIEGERHRWQLRMLRRILALLSRRPACVMVNSEAGQRAHESADYHPRRWEIVPNGFDVELFRPDPRRRAEWRQRLALAATQSVIGMVARVDGMKDHATFLAAAAALAAEHPDLRVLLIGAGTERLTVPPGLAGLMQALGERDKLHELLPALDIMVLASKGEGFPNAVGEAMACGVACVASDVGDAAQIIGETGAIAAPRDPAALAAAMSQLLAQGPAGLTRLGAAARERIVAHYSIAAAVRRYETIYATIAAER